MYKLILSDEHKQIIKETFLSFYQIRQNYWHEFLKDIDANEEYESLFENAYKTACPDYEKVYKVIKKDEIIETAGFDISYELFVKIMEEVFKFDDLKEIKDILYVVEEFMRTRMGQFFDFADDVATNGWVYDNTKPDNNKKFNEYIERRNLSRNMLEEAFAKAVGYPKEKSKKVLLAQDLYDVLKHQIYLDTPSMHGSWTVYSNKPMNWSGVVPVPKIEKL